MSRKEIGIPAWLVRKVPEDGENADELFLDEMQADYATECEEDSLGMRKGRFLTDEEIAALEQQLAAAEEREQAANDRLALDTDQLQHEIEVRDREISDLRARNSRLWKMLDWWIRHHQNSRNAFEAAFTETTTVTIGPYGDVGTQSTDKEPSEG